jgi:hypothetical protein
MTSSTVVQITAFVHEVPFLLRTLLICSLNVEPVHDLIFIAAIIAWQMKSVLFGMVWAVLFSSDNQCVFCVMQLCVQSYSLHLHMLHCFDMTHLLFLIIALFWHDTLALPNHISLHNMLLSCALSTRDPWSSCFVVLNCTCTCSNCIQSYSGGSIIIDTIDFTIWLIGRVPYCYIIFKIVLLVLIEFCDNCTIFMAFTTLYTILDNSNALMA